ncbi:hypothetical protein [Ekhidna sp.]
MLKTATIILLTLLSASLSPQFFSSQRVIAIIEDERLIEASGLEESHQNPGYFWTHNDSGGRPMLFLIDTNGQVKMEVKLEGIINRDWEEIVTVREGNTSYIYVAEIGDNRAVYDEVKLIRLEEPKFDKRGSVSIPKEEIAVMQFQYQEGSRDAEAIMYDKRTEEFVLITKREKKSMVYSFPFKESAKTVIKSKGTIPSRNFTAADINEDGEILLKHYDAIYFWSASKKPALERILDWNPINIAYAPEPQGEAMCWYKKNFYTLSEKNEGKPQEMLVFERMK